MNFFRKRDKYCSEYVSVPPKHMTIHVTSACSYKCLFCSYHGDDAKEASNVYANGLQYQLSLEDFEKMVNMAKDSGVKGIHICATGEPFMNPNILQMLDYVIEKYGKVSFQSDFNRKLYEGLGYLDEIVKRADFIKSITVDLLSADEETHAKIKKGGNLEDLLYAMEYIATRTNICFNITVILTKQNYKALYKIIPMLKQRNIFNFNIGVVNLLAYDYSEFSSPKNVYTSLDKDITKELKKFKKVAKENKINISIPKPADKTTAHCTIFWNKIYNFPTKGCDREKYIYNIGPIACAAVVRGELSSLGYLFDYDNFIDAMNSEEFVKVRRGIINNQYPSEYCKICCHYPLKDSVYKRYVKEQKRRKAGR